MDCGWVFVGDVVLFMDFYYSFGFDYFVILMFVIVDLVVDDFVG